MVTRDDVLQVLAAGKTQAEAAGELGISRSRASRLLSGRSGNEARARRADATVTQSPGDATVTQSPGDATTQHRPDAMLTQQSASTSPDLAALREQHRAEFTAGLRPRWDALAAERDQLRARVAELENSPAGPPAPPQAGCPGCGERDAAYEELEDEAAQLRRRLAAWEEPA